MTQPTPPTDRRFARDVAKQIDRRRVRRRLTLWSALLALVAAAGFYLRCGSGFGLGGPGGFGGPDGDGDQRGTGTARPVAGPLHCAIRVSASGITVDGKPRSRDEAVAVCKATRSADVIVTGDARQGDWLELRAALEAAGVKLRHEPAKRAGP